MIKPGERRHAPDERRTEMDGGIMNQMRLGILQMARMLGKITDFKMNYLILDLIKNAGITNREMGRTC